MGLTLPRPAVTVKNKSRKHESSKTRKGDEKNFVLKNIFHKMKKITIKQLSANGIPAG